MDSCAPVFARLMARPVNPSSLKTKALAAGEASSLMSRASRPISLLAIWVLFNLLFGSLLVRDRVYLSDLTLIAVCFMAGLRCCIKLKFIHMAVALFLILIATLWALSVGALDNPRFVPEFAKILLLLTSGLLLANAISWKDVKAISQIFPLVLLMILVGVKVLGLGDYYGGEGRFGVSWWGSPNNTGFVISIALALLLFDLRSSKIDFAHRKHKPASCGFKWLQLLFLALFLLATQSDGGILIAGVIVLRYLGISLRTILSVFFAGVLTFICVVSFMSFIHIPELIGSGRLFIWKALIAEQFSGEPLLWFFGHGPGAIELHPWFTALVLSAHSMYVEILYGFGLVGLFVLFGVLFWSARKLARANLSSPQRALLEAVFCALVVSFFVDTYLMTAQLTWLGALLLGMGGLVSTKRTKYP